MGKECFLTKCFRRHICRGCGRRAPGHGSPTAVSSWPERRPGCRAATAVGRTLGGPAHRQGEALRETLGSGMKHAGPWAVWCAAFTTFLAPPVTQMCPAHTGLQRPSPSHGSPGRQDSQGSNNLNSLHLEVYEDAASSPVRTWSGSRKRMQIILELERCQLPSPCFWLLLPGNSLSCLDARGADPLAPPHSPHSPPPSSAVLARQLELDLHLPEPPKHRPVQAGPLAAPSSWTSLPGYLLAASHDSWVNTMVPTTERPSLSTRPVQRSNLPFPRSRSPAHHSVLSPSQNSSLSEIVTFYFFFLAYCQSPSMRM